MQAVRVACDGRILSYDILLSNGGVTVRHRKYMMKTSQGLLTGADRVPADSRSADQGLMNVGSADQGLMNVGADLGVVGLGAGGMETSRESVSRPLSDQVIAGASGESGQLSRLRPRTRI